MKPFRSYVFIAVGMIVVYAGLAQRLDHGGQGSRRSSLLLFLLPGMALAGGGSLLYLNHQRRLEQQVIERTQELEQRVTQRTQELDLERARLRTILEAMDDGVIYREDGQVKYLNPAVCRIMGYPSEEIMNHPQEIYQAALSANTPAQRAEIRRKSREALAPGTFYRDKIKVRRKDGSVFDASIYTAVIRDAQGQVIGNVDGIRDISQEKALQEQTDRFITNASHELRRPLSNLNARLYLLARQPEKMAEHLGVIQKSVDDMSDLVKDLVDVAQFTSEEIPLSRKVVVVQHALNAALMIQKPLAERRQVQLGEDIPPEPVYVLADYQWLVQTFNNLICGVIRFLSCGGRVQVRLFTRTRVPETWVVIQIQDSGPGLDPEQLPLIFDPFFRPSEGDMQATGLELALARHIVERHGGLVTVESDPLAGNTFTVQLRACSAPVTHAK